MGGGAGGPPPPPSSSWRAVALAAVALWLVPAVLALAVLWLPLLCCAVAAVRFVRVRRKLVVASRRSSSSRGCYDGDGDGDGDGDHGTEERTMVDDDDAGGGRLRLLHQYLDDQMDLVGVGGGRDEQEQGSIDSSPVRPASC